MDLTLRNGIIHIKAGRTLTWQDVAAMGMAVRAFEESLPQAPDRVLDLTDCAAVALDFPQVERIAEVRNRAQLANPVRLAVIAPSDLNFGVARMFQSLISNPMINFQIFRNPDQAAAWITRQPLSASPPLPVRPWTGAWQPIEKFR